MKVYLPQFHDQFHIEDFFDWLNEVERFFDYIGILEGKQVILVAYKLKRRAVAWWEQL